MTENEQNSFQARILLPVPGVPSLMFKITGSQSVGLHLSFVTDDGRVVGQLAIGRLRLSRMIDAVVQNERTRKMPVGVPRPSVGFEPGELLGDLEGMIDHSASAAFSASARANLPARDVAMSTDESPRELTDEERGRYGLDCNYAGDSPLQHMEPTVPEPETTIRQEAPSEAEPERRIERRMELPYRRLSRLIPLAYACCIGGIGAYALMSYQLFAHEPVRLSRLYSLLTDSGRSGTSLAYTYDAQGNLLNAVDYTIVPGDSAEIVTKKAELTGAYTIVVEGVVNLGEGLGYVGPSGLDAGLESSPYTRRHRPKIVGSKPFGALLFRKAGEEAWNLAVTGSRVETSRGRPLEFLFNDSGPEANTGSFVVNLLRAR